VNLNAIPRRNPYLNDAIEHLDQYYLRTNGDSKKARKLLSTRENDFIEAEMEHCIIDACYYLENYHVIQPIEGKMQTLTFMDSQQMIYDVVIQLQRKGLPVKIVCLKARQIGSSTLSEGLIFHKTIFTRGCNTLIVAQDPATAGALFEMSRLAYDRLPWWMRPEARYDAKGKYMVFDKRDDTERQFKPGMRSQIIVESANKLTQAGRGKTFLAVHLCLSDKNPVILADSKLASIADVRVGDVIRSDKGLVSVKAISRRQAETVYRGAENGYKITAWCNSAFPIEGTGNHKVLCVDLGKRSAGNVRIGYRRETILTNRRMIELRELSKSNDGIGHALVIPVRPITVGGKLPPCASRGYRAQGGGKQSAWNVPLPDREFGFAVGLYLAEGSCSGGQVCISLDKDEKDLADRFSRAVGIKYGKITSDNKSRTRVFHFYNSAFSVWIKTVFGELSGKMIPDVCWTMGREFLAGILEGAILGDGHLDDDENCVNFTSIRVQLSLAIRDAMASLGHGYGGIYFRPAGFWYGRNCQSIWTVILAGDGSDSMRREYGWQMSKKRATKNSRHWYYSLDHSEVYIRIRKVERVDLDLVYDIEVDSDDHTFLLPSAITHNSELSSWPDGGLLSKSLFPTMHAEDELAFMESTALGRQGFWYEWWKGVESGEISDWTPIFIPYYTIKKYSKPIPERIAFKLTEEEKHVRERVKDDTEYTIPDATFNWVRMKKAEFIRLEGDEFGFFGEYPSNPTEAFQTSGMCAFPKKLLQRILETTCCKPRWYGEIYYKSTSHKDVYNFYDPVKQEMGHLHRVVKGERIPPAKEEGERFRVWEGPEDGAEYYMAVDVAMGEEGGDFTCIEVLRIGRGQNPDVQVAEWRGWINPTDAACVAAAIGYWYNNAEISIEVNSEGAVTNNHIFRVLEYDPLYRWKYIDKISNFITPYFGWYTNSKTRPLIIVKMREALMEKTIIIRSEDLIDEMMAFTREEGEEKFMGRGTHDDRVMSICICRYCAHEFDYADQTNSKSRASVATNETFYIFDEQNRLRFHTGDREAAEMHVRTHPGWAMRGEPQKKDYANTDYSPIHDKAGLHQEMYRAGVKAEEIPVDVSMYADFNRGLMRGEVDDWRAT
jgi:hypothetical protein